MFIVLLSMYYTLLTLYICQVNMMSAQMLASADTVAGTVSDLAPGAKDGMRMLEARAVAMNQHEEVNPSRSLPPVSQPQGTVSPLCFTILAFHIFEQVVVLLGE